MGAGWAGCAAAVEAVRQGHQVSLFEASRTPGGRARKVEVAAPSPAGGETRLALDNGQHILIGAYTESLRLMSELGLHIENAFLRLPLTLRMPDGNGFLVPNLPVPFDALAGIFGARGWNWRDKMSMLRAALRWQRLKFQCPPEATVADLCTGLTPQVMRTLIEPLCVSALNTPTERASGQVFLTVLHDSLFTQSGGSNLLLPRTDLSALLPDLAISWLRGAGATVHLGRRIQTLGPCPSAQPAWQLDEEPFDAVILACPPGEAARLVQNTGLPALAGWQDDALSLTFEAITTCYAMAPGTRLKEPMLTLPNDAEPHSSAVSAQRGSKSAMPAQFVFDRGQLDGPPGLLAFVVSASQGDSALLTEQVLAQGRLQLGLAELRPIKTVVEKRATFACVPGLKRPTTRIATGLLACGDYVEGPYPATLEGAVRSGLRASRLLEAA